MEISSSTLDMVVWSPTLHIQHQYWEGSWHVNLELGKVEVGDIHLVITGVLVVFKPWKQI